MRRASLFRISMGWRPITGKMESGFIETRMPFGGKSTPFPAASLALTSTVIVRSRLFQMAVGTRSVRGCSTSKQSRVSQARAGCPAVISRTSTATSGPIGMGAGAGGAAAGGVPAGAGSGKIAGGTISGGSGRNVIDCETGSSTFAIAAIFASVDVPATI